MGKIWNAQQKMFKRKMKSLRTARVRWYYRWWDANVRNVVTVQMTINVNFESFTLLNWAGCWFVHKQLINLSIPPRSIDLKYRFTMQLYNWYGENKWICRIRFYFQSFIFGHQLRFNCISRLKCICRCVLLYNVRIQQ